MKSAKSMKPKVLGPYTEQDLKQWNEALRLCAMAREQIELAEQAGFPSADQLQAVNALCEQLTRMKSVYAPGYP